MRVRGLPSIARHFNKTNESADSVTMDGSSSSLTTGLAVRHSKRRKLKSKRAFRSASNF